MQNRKDGMTPRTGGLHSTTRGRERAKLYVGIGRNWGFCSSQSVRQFSIHAQCIVTSKVFLKPTLLAVPDDTDTGLAMSSPDVRVRLHNVVLHG